MELIKLEDIIDYDLTWMDHDKKQSYVLITMLLGRIYYQTNWRKIASNKISTDIFEHRIKVSSRKQSIAEFINQLCNQLSIQALHDHPELIFQLESRSSKILNIIRRQSQLCVMLAKRYSKYLKKVKTNENN